MPPGSNLILVRFDSGSSKVIGSVFSSVISVPLWFLFSERG